MVRSVSSSLPLFRITGVALGSFSNNYEGRFVSVARSFREPDPATLRRIREERLGLATAQAGETLAQLGKRTGNTWGIQRTALMNDMFSNEPLEPGQLVKIAVSKPYDPSAP